MELISNMEIKRGERIFEEKEIDNHWSLTIQVKIP